MSEAELIDIERDARDLHDVAQENADTFYQRAEESPNAKDEARFVRCAEAWGKVDRVSVAALHLIDAVRVANHNKEVPRR